MAYGDIATPRVSYSRDLLLADGVHRNLQGGICGSGGSDRGAESIVLSGEYEDDVDDGDTILYTGQAAVQGRPTVGTSGRPDVGSVISAPGCQQISTTGDDSAAVG